MEVNNNCEYTGTELDANGDAYAPNPRNIMSYSQGFCKNYFSPEQTQFMQNTIDALYADYSCAITSAEEVTKNEAIELFPNPSEGLVHIRFPYSAPQEPYQIKVYNALGRTVLHSNQTGDKHLDLKHLSPGIYLVEIYLEKEVIRKQILRI